MMLGLLGLEELQLSSITRVIDATQIASLSVRSLTFPPDADWDGVQQPTLASLNCEEVLKFFKLPPHAAVK
jgi:hypothetical protein